MSDDEWVVSGPRLGEGTLGDTGGCSRQTGHGGTPTQTCDGCRVSPEQAQRSSPRGNLLSLSI